MMDGLRKLHSMEWGARQRMSVVLLHGLYGSAREWHPLASAWRDLGGYAVAFDLRNHGSSFHAATQGVSEMAGDVQCGLSSVLGASDGSVVLVGHSMGGQVAQHLAMGWDRASMGWDLRGVVLLDSALVWMGMPEWLCARHREWHEVLVTEARRGGGDRKTVLARLQRVLPEGVARYLVTNYVREDARGGYRWRLGLEGIGDYLHALSNLGDAIHIAARLWMVRGAGSPYTAHIDGGMLRRYAPNGRLLTVFGAGDPHYPHHMDRDRVLELLRSLCF